MRRLFVCSLLFACGAALAGSYGPNLLPNGNFDGSLVGWTSSNTGSCTASYDQGKAYLSCGALAVSGQRARIQSTNFQTYAGRFYRVTGTVNLVGTSNVATVWVYLLDGNIETTAWTTASTSPQIVNFEHFYQADGNTVNVRLNVQATNSGAWFDDIKVEEVIFDSNNTSPGAAQESTLLEVAASTEAAASQVAALAPLVSAAASAVDSVVPFVQQAASAAELAKGEVEALKGLGRVFAWAASVLAGFLMGVRLA